MDTTSTTTKTVRTTGSLRATETKAKPTQRLRRTVLAIALIMGVFVMTVGVESASAMWIGPEPRTPAGLSSSKIVCGTNKVRINIQAEPQATHPGGQWVAARYWGSANHGETGAWSAWTRKFVYFSQYGQADVFDYTWTVANGGHYMAYTQLLWWNGTSWTNPQNQWAARGQAGFYITTYEGYCMT